MRKLFFFSLLNIAFFVTLAQNDSSTYLEPRRSSYKYIGIQSNLLLQQFISFNSNSSINNNPYTFYICTNNAATGNGFALGTGFNISERSSDDGVSSIHINNVNISLRTGYEKKYLQHQKFIPFWGVEFGFGVLYSKQTSRLSQTFNTNEVTVESTKYFVGPSLRGGLNYALSKHILLGTEFFINSQISTTKTNSIGNGNNFIGSSQSFVPFNIGIQAPTALFLIFRY